MERYEMGQLWSSILYALVGAIIGAIIAFVLTKRKFEKELRDNPPISEKMIRAMFLQMGRKPSEAQIRQIMKTVNSNSKNKK
ncbi:YneF family protein [Erysipelotrichaceae bacterium 51-3]|uniref:YneF family protein n=1 Tax=Allobaculum sp. JKK-2023 TaxID=3108943 RepID=UPI002B05B092|nr:YneF family protein [Allobaculum sp. JKK-2023]